MKLTGEQVRVRDSAGRIIKFGKRQQVELDVCGIASVSVYEDYCVDPRNSPEIDTRAVLIRMSSGASYAVPDEDGSLYAELVKELGHG